MTDKTMQREDEIQIAAQKIVQRGPEREIQSKEYVPAGPITLSARTVKLSAGKIRLVILESPLAPKNGRTFEDNKTYARICMRDSLLRGESPLASHLTLDQPGILDDLIPEERELGIEAGLAWGRVADATVVYTDYGVSDGMQRGIDRAKAESRSVEFRHFAGLVRSKKDPTR